MAPGMRPQRGGRRDKLGTRGQKEGRGVSQNSDEGCLPSTQLCGVPPRPAARGSPAPPPAPGPSHCHEASRCRPETRARFKSQDSRLLGKILLRDPALPATRGSAATESSLEGQSHGTAPSTAASSPACHLSRDNYEGPSLAAQIPSHSCTLKSEKPEEGVSSCY